MILEGLRNFGGGFEHPKPPLGTPLLPTRVIEGSVRLSYVVVEVGQTASAYPQCVPRHDRPHPLHVAHRACLCVL